MRIIDVKAGFAHCQIVFAQTLIVVDAGDAGPICSALEREGAALKDVGRILLTHGDSDHWRGAMELRDLCDAELLAHENERGYLEGTDVPRFSVPKRLLIRLGRGLRRPRVDRWLHGGEMIDGLEVIHTPGHTPGHISVRAGDTVLAGDAFTSGARFREVPRLMTADLARSRDSIRELAKLDVARAFSGHGLAAEGAALKLRALAASLPA